MNLRRTPRPAGLWSKRCLQILQKCKIWGYICNKVRWFLNPAFDKMDLEARDKVSRPLARKRKLLRISQIEKGIFMSYLEVSSLKKVYRSKKGGSAVEALKNVNFEVEQGEFVAIMGESGSGKTTLLNILAALDRPTSGAVVLDGKNFAGIKESEVSKFRRDNLGFVFQDFNLLDTFTLEDNIYLPLVLANTPYKEMNERLLPIVTRLGIADLLRKYPYEVSGGQKQRAAVARALITNPKIILADEPTGALDSKATDELLRLFSEINKSGQTILMVTHSVKAASSANRVLFIKDGEVFHQIYRGEESDEQLYGKISDTLTLLATGGERHE